MQVYNATKVLSCGELKLRPFNMNDVGDVYSILSQEMIKIFFPTYSPHINYEITYQKIENIVKSYSQNTHIWVIEYINEIIGFIEVVDIIHNLSLCKIKYYICSKIKDENIINTSKKLVKRYIIKYLNINSVEYINLLNCN